MDGESESASPSLIAGAAALEAASREWGCLLAIQTKILGAKMEETEETLAIVRPQKLRTSKWFLN